jgi:23S rRNA (cytosine1962-C5)-methyltransferase
VREPGLVFEVDLLHGHKSGLYLDQRDNRQLVRHHASGRTVLNLFGYTGGFALAAAAGGARATTSVDLAEPAVQAARRNLRQNGFAEPAHRAVTEDVLELARRGWPSGGPWDLVVVDPPAFAPHRASLARALVAYRRLNATVLRRARPGSLVLTCSCSSHVDRALFLQLIDAAAEEAGARIERLAVCGAAADHPVIPEFPEGDYLKAAFLRVLSGGARRSGRPPGGPGRVIRKSERQC